jgi:hypothetical protein
MTCGGFKMYQITIFEVIEKMYADAAAFAATKVRLFFGFAKKPRGFSGRGEKYPEYAVKKFNELAALWSIKRAKLEIKRKEWRRYGD